MHQNLKFLVVDQTRRPPHGHTVSEYETHDEAFDARDRYNANFPFGEGPAIVVVTKAEEN